MRLIILIIFVFGFEIQQLLGCMGGKLFRTQPVQNIAFFEEPFNSINQHGPMIEHTAHKLAENLSRLPYLNNNNSKAILEKIRKVGSISGKIHHSTISCMNPDKHHRLANFDHLKDVASQFKELLSEICVSEPANILVAYLPRLHVLSSDETATLVATLTQLGQTYSNRIDELDTKVIAVTNVASE
ncbi:uncharacterized protein LOC116344265 [Contarinia nasturtii]|uniref:uncharacterized protein LOC116344265 n=1 Tax=Contarinia nasturtii TaxID=265458 RepID=UPI0012D44D2B|nr:uncharacterized protein LOC116344265 [Contarinia nasturtii]